MSDPSRQNAICFALKRLLAEGAEVALRDRPRNRVEAVVNGSIVLPLPREMAVWWKRVLVGHRAQPIAALIEIPVDLLSPSLRGLIPAQDEIRHPVYSWVPEPAQANAA